MGGGQERASVRGRLSSRWRWPSMASRTRWWRAASLVPAATLRVGPEVADVVELGAQSGSELVGGNEVVDEPVRRPPRELTGTSFCGIRPSTISRTRRNVQ